MRKRLTVLCLFLLVGGLAGCASSERSTIFSGGYWKRHIKKFGDDMHQFRVDIDRTIFDLDDRPIEED
ncbi:MAG: hypothetical protein ACKVX7_12335 [Planctomycetota bacterium]